MEMVLKNELFCLFNISHYMLKSHGKSRHYKFHHQSLPTVLLYISLQDINPYELMLAVRVQDLGMSSFGWLITVNHQVKVHG